jgi:monooxygenase
VDVLIVGAGISGIAAAYRLQTMCPDKTFEIVEARDAIGGTWDLFRFPGIRSDSDLHTLGFPFRPWRGSNTIADGASILAYVRETAAAYGIDRKIRFRTRVETARWSSRDARWTVELSDGTQVECRFLYLCTGYFDYERGHAPEFPGAERFAGRTVHPQQWPEDLDYTGKRVVVIGSGATAVTMVPVLAERAAHVTMLQRSPTYVISVAARDRSAAWLRERVPRGAFHITRWKYILLGAAFYAYCRRFPEHAKRLILAGVRKEVQREDAVAQFTPTYDPWDQRVCFIPDADLFAAVRERRATVVTDHVERITETGIELRSGATLPADVIVTATGLRMKWLGGITLEVDGTPVELPKTMVYRGTMLSGVPNFAFATGYTNASWTLRCDLTSQFVCRLLAHMDRHGFTRCVPRREPDVDERPLITLTSGYVQRTRADAPTQGTRGRWRMSQNYLRDRIASWSRLEDRCLELR